MKLIETEVKSQVISDCENTKYLKTNLIIAYLSKYLSMDL